MLKWCHLVIPSLSYVYYVMGLGKRKRGEVRGGNNKRDEHFIIACKKLHVCQLFYQSLSNTLIFLLTNVAILLSASLTHSLSHSHTYYLTFSLPVVYNNTYEITNSICPCFSSSFFFRLSRCTWMEEAQMTLVTSLSPHRLASDSFNLLHSLESLITLFFSPFFQRFLPLFLSYIFRILRSTICTSPLLISM
jgi:hypothetical protein